MSGRRSQRKGRRFEQEIARALRPVWSRARRGIGQARSAGEVPDVDGTPFWIEAKHRARISIAAAWRQARDASDGRPPAAVTREDHGPVLITLELRELVRLLGGEA